MAFQNRLIHPGRFWLLLLIFFGNVVAAIAADGPSGQEKHYVQLTVIGKIDAGQNSVTASGEPPEYADAAFAVDFSKSPQAQADFREMNGKTSVVRGYYVQCTREGKNGKPRCNANQSPIGLFLQPVSIQTLRTPDGDVSTKDHSVSVVCRGLLHTGVVAVGGETTGFTIEITPDGRETWELDMSRKLLSKAMKADGKSVVVSGQLKIRKSVAVPERWVITVRSLATEPDAQN
ncbi:hypothetical protein GC176_04135 [bacterium]|nr:hypothetical protein [bacterium]